jgi:hypothetical protein
VRGLPPPPPNVARVNFDCTTDSARWTIGFWIEMFPLGPYTLADLQGVLAQVTIAGTQFVNQLTTAASKIDTCRLALQGPQIAALFETVAFNVGALSGAQANQVSTALHWITGDPGRSGQAMTYMGGFSDDFTDDHLVLNDVGMNTVRNEARNFLNAVDATFFGAILQCTLGTLHRSRAGTPLLVATFSPFVGIAPARKLGTIRRRMYARR